MRCMYYIYFCLNGDMENHASVLETNKYIYDRAVDDIWPFDVIDEDDHIDEDGNHIYERWFDYGDE